MPQCGVRSSAECVLQISDPKQEDDYHSILVQFGARRLSEFFDVLATKEDVMVQEVGVSQKKIPYIVQVHTL